MDSLVIRHHRATYRVPAGADPAVGSEGLDEACSTLLAASLSSLSLGQGSGVWLIRHLDVRSPAMAHWPPERIAAGLADRIAATLREVVARGPDGLNVLWFPTRAAWIARLLVEAAEGTAGKAWTFSEFADLLDRGCGELLLELCRREPETVREAIGGLLPLEERLILRHVPAGTAKQILRTLSQTEPAPQPAALEAALGALERLAKLGDLPEPEATLALQLLFSAVRTEAPSSGGSSLAGACLQIAALATALGARDPSTARAWAAGDWGALKRAMGAEELARLAALEPVPPETRRRLAEAVAATAAGAAREESSTPFGGMFLLLPLLEAFDWRVGSGENPGLEGHDPAQLWQLLAVAGGLGARKARRVLDDPVLRECLGIDPALTLAQIVEWAASVPDRASLARRWVESLERSGLIGSTERTLAASPNGPMLVDRPKGVWMGRAAGTPLVEIGGDEAALHLGALFPDAPEIAELLLLASQALLREFAWRLPGFAGSSIPFLHENLLEFPASVEAQDDQRWVFVGNPPLHVLLSLTGMNRRRFRLPASGGLDWILASRS